MAVERMLTEASPPANWSAACCMRPASNMCSASPAATPAASFRACASTRIPSAW